MMSRLSACLVVLVVSVIGPSRIALGQDIPVREILSVGDPMPGSAGLVNGIGTPSIDAGQLAYGVTDDGTYRAMFLQAATGGRLTTLVDSQAMIPNTNTGFFSWSVPRVRGGTAVFYGRDRPLIAQGLYHGSGGPLGVFADRATTAFSGFSNSNFAFDGQNVAFYGVDPAAGLFLGSIGSSVYRVIVRGNDPLPGDPTAIINTIYAPSLRGGWLVFAVRVTDTQTFQFSYAVLRYELSTQVLSTVVGRQSVVPGIGGTFTLIQNATTDGTSIVFAGSQGNPNFGGWNGLCRWRSGTLSVLVDNSAPLPGSNQPRPQFGGANSGFLALGNNVVFSSGDGINGQTMLYALWQGRIVRLVVRGDALTGGTLDDLWFSQDGFDGRYATFLGRHGLGSSSSLYVLDLACANVESYGAGCHPSGGGVPELVSTGCPASGESFALATRQSLGNFAVAVIGGGRVATPLLGCELLVGPTIVTSVMPLQAGAGTLGLGVVPSGYSGLRLTAQVFSLEPGTLGLAATNGVDITLF